MIVIAGIIMIALPRNNGSIGNKVIGIWCNKSDRVEGQNILVTNRNWGEGNKAHH